jgi:hypothetical protein
MTMTLAHPAAEDLGRFVEGTLDDAGRTAVVEHIADCDECRIVVVDASAFEQESVAGTDGFSWNWWHAAAAAIAVVVAVSFYTGHRDRLGKLAATSADLSFRPTEGRLNRFPYRPFKARTRGGENPESQESQESWKLGEPAADILERKSDDAETLHEQGVAHLVLGERPDAIKAIAAATQKAPNEATYWSDLAVAQIASGDAAHALESADRALKLHPGLPDALFNRALALQALGNHEAASAYERYIRIDPNSQWSEDARKRVADLHSLGE